ncbi:hypothetical protein TNCV_4786051 [Trichonephila clavipes]|nr:hypothetical protein TNCV_4786051 [Trichonephila clavipes]
MLFQKHFKHAVRDSCLKIWLVNLHSMSPASRYSLTKRARREQVLSFIKMNRIPFAPLKSIEDLIPMQQNSRPSGRVVSDADCCAVRPGSNPVEGMDVCKCIVPSRHGSIINSHRAANPLVKLVEGEA